MRVAYEGAPLWSRSAERNSDDGGFWPFRCAFSSAAPNEDPQGRHWPRRCTPTSCGGASPENAESSRHCLMVASKSRPRSCSSKRSCGDALRRLPSGKRKKLLQEDNGIKVENNEQRGGTLCRQNDNTDYSIRTDLPRVMQGGGGAALLHQKVLHVHTEKAGATDSSDARVGSITH